jgi:glycosyltransferase involved in cell wall biosynthesis
MDYRINILVANNHLAKTGGTENYTLALASTLMKMGCKVEYFTFEKGLISDKLEEMGISFMSKNKYDLILANHNTTVDLLYKQGFIIQTCHGIYPELEQPSKRADLYVAVSEEINHYLEGKGLKSTVINNGIDCERFRIMNPINKSIRSVLSLCQGQTANALVATICETRGFRFLQANKFTDNVFSIENLINQADIVVGIGRSLYDAMACGRPVISYDSRSYSDNWGDGYLNEANIAESLKCNCSGRSFRIHFDEESLSSELDKYKISDGFFLREFALQNLNVDINSKKYLDLFKHEFTVGNRIKKCMIIFFNSEFYHCIRHPRHLLWRIKSILAH